MFITLGRKPSYNQQIITNIQVAVPILPQWEHRMSFCSRCLKIDSSTMLAKTVVGSLLFVGLFVSCYFHAQIKVVFNSGKFVLIVYLQTRMVDSIVVLY